MARKKSKLPAALKASRVFAAYKHCIGDNARDKDGRSCHPTAKNAVSLSLCGAVLRAYDKQGFEYRQKFRTLLESFIGGDLSLNQFSDGSDKSAILAVLIEVEKEFHGFTG